MDKVEKVARAIPDEAVEAALDAYNMSASRSDERRIASMDCMRAAIQAALAAMGEPASHPLNTSAVVSHEAENVSDKAATRKEALQVEAIRQAILDNCWGDSNGNVNGSILAASAIATAIRARGER